ncbi:inner centromere protein A-like [Papaver somniferum]|uniref:inner centromere protein A-like n=1 Tax=Papaver somniferum TaxID=3469 RepID=UPI000E6FF606|nr:inner centromere protein A-like [Papaver somniferum]
MRKILEDILGQDKGKSHREKENEDSDPHREQEHHIHKQENNLKDMQNSESGSHIEHDPILSQPTQQSKETHISLEDTQNEEEENKKKLEELAKEREKEEEEQKKRKMREKQRKKEEAQRNRELLEQQKREEEEKRQRSMEIQQREQEEREAYRQRVWSRYNLEKLTTCKKFTTILRRLWASVPPGLNIKQRPHYAPFSKYQSLTSDSIKKGLDFGFYSLTRIVTGDSIHPCTFLQNLEDYRSDVSDFEEFGFEVTKLREILSAREDIADDMNELEAKKGRQKRLNLVNAQRRNQPLPSSIQLFFDEKIEEASIVFPSAPAASLPKLCSLGLLSNGCFDRILVGNVLDLCDPVVIVLGYSYLATVSVLYWYAERSNNLIEKRENHETSFPRFMRWSPHKISGSIQTFKSSSFRNIKSNFGSQVENDLEKTMITPFYMKSQVEKLQEKITELQNEVNDQRQKQMVVNVKLCEIQESLNEDPEGMEVVRKILEDLLKQSKEQPQREQEKEDSHPHTEKEHSNIYGSQNAQHPNSRQPAQGNNDTNQHHQNNQQNEPHLQQENNQKKRDFLDTELGKTKKEEDERVKQDLLAKELARKEKEEKEQKIREMHEKRIKEEEQVKQEKLAKEELDRKEEEEQKLREILEKQNEKEERVKQDLLAKKELAGKEEEEQKQR